MNMSMSSWSESFPSKPKGGFDGLRKVATEISDVQHLEFRPTLQLEALVRFCTVFGGFCCWGVILFRVPGTQLCGRMLGSWRIGRGVFPNVDDPNS